MTPECTLLHQLLIFINESETIAVENGNFVPSHPLIHALLYIAEHCLTGEDGPTNIHTLQKAGWTIYPGDQDRFGWLTGCIELKRGLIVFG